MLIHFLVVLLLFFLPVWKIPGPVGGDDAASLFYFIFFPTVCLRRSESKAATNPALLLLPPYPPHRNCTEHLCSGDSLSHGYSRAHSGRLALHSRIVFRLSFFYWAAGVYHLTLSFSLDSSKGARWTFTGPSASHSNAPRCVRRCTSTSATNLFSSIGLSFLLSTLYQFPYKVASSDFYETRKQLLEDETNHLFFFSLFPSLHRRDEDLSWWVATFPSCQRGPPFQLTSRPKRYTTEETVGEREREDGEVVGE